MSNKTKKDSYSAIVLKMGGKRKISKKRTTNIPDGSSYYAENTRDRDRGDNKDGAA